MGWSIAGAGDSAAVVALQAAVAMLQGESAYWLDQKAVNTAGGTFTSGAWRTRDLNTEAFNDITGASLDSGTGRITLPAGTYWFEARAPVFNVQLARTRLWNVTTSTVLIPGGSLLPNADGTAAELAQVDGVLRRKIVLAVESELEVQQVCASTKATNGFGVPANLLSVPEIYTEVWVQKLV